MVYLDLIGRTQELFSNDFVELEEKTEDSVQFKFLVIGGAGSIGQAVKRNLQA